MDYVPPLGGGGLNPLRNAEVRYALYDYLFKLAIFYHLANQCGNLLRRKSSARRHVLDEVGNSVLFAARGCEFKNRRLKPLICDVLFSELLVVAVVLASQQVKFVVDEINECGICGNFGELSRVLKWSRLVSFLEVELVVAMVSILSA